MNLLLAIKTLRFIPVFFLLCVFVAALFYPGGNIHDSSQEGYSFTHNFLSDLGGYESHSSEQNFLSNFFFNMSMFVFALVGIAFLWIPQLFRDNTLNWYLSCLGSFFLFIGTIFFAGVGLTPYDLYLDIHIFFALNAFRLMVPGCLCFLIVLLRSNVQKRYAFIAGFYLFSVVAYVCYQLLSTGNPFEDINEMIRQATIQKIIVILSVISVLSFSFAFEAQIKILQQTNINHADQQND